MLAIIAIIVLISLKDMAMSQVDDVVKTFEGLKCREDEATNHCHNLYCHYCHIKIAIIIPGHPWSTLPGFRVTVSLSEVNI